MGIWRTFRSNIQNRRKRVGVFRPAQAAQCARPSDRLKESAWQPHGNADLSELLFKRARGGDAEVEDAGGECGVGFATAKDVGKVGDGSGAARGNDGNAYRLTDGGG